MSHNPLDWSDGIPDCIIFASTADAERGAAMYRSMADALDAKDARIKELEGKIHEQQIWMHAEIDRHSEEIRRFGCPYVSTVSSQEDGFYLAHPIISAIPTPEGLRVVIASTRARAEGADMTPEQEDAPIEIALSQVPKDSSDPWADHVRLAIRAAYAQGVAQERERCAYICDRWSGVGDVVARAIAAAIRRGE